MTAMLKLQGWWRIINGMITLPVVSAAGATQADVDNWVNADEMANGLITLKLAHNLHASQVGITANTT